MLGFDHDTAVTASVSGGDGRFTATLREHWNIWGPNGGYVIAVALRAAGAHSDMPRPASLSTHLLGVAKFGEVDLEVTTVRKGKRSESLKVSMTQEGRPICDTMVWTVDPGGGVESNWTTPPDVPGPHELPTIAERVAQLPAAQRRPPFAFWENFEARMVDWLDPQEWESLRPVEPSYRGWFKFVPEATFGDAYLDAGRSVVLLDVGGWPAATRGFAPENDGRWMAPNMDLTVNFHQAAPDSEYLFLDMRAPLATGGLIAGSGQVWSEDGRLLASAMQHMLCRPLPG